MSEYELFQSALAIPDPAARQQFLKKSCAQNETLKSRVEALLASHEGQSQFLEIPVVEQIAECLHSEDRATIVDGSGPTSANKPDLTEIHIRGAATMTKLAEESDDENPLGYLEPSSKPDSLGRLGHYEVLEVVGRGAFGTVLRAFDEKLHRVVAIKVLAPEMAATSPARKRFLREAQASAAIRHEHVVSIYAVEEKPIPYLVMEYIPGLTLQQRLDEQGPLGISNVLRLGRQIAEGLAAAHAQDLIHRDVKPGNILLETSIHDRVKITDFGLARAADDASLTQSGMIAGTPMYMAPEQALGHKFDQRADLFSFGSVLYQMVSGRPPFRAPSALAVLKRVVDETPRPISEIIPETPQWLCRVISKLHAKNPGDRYQSAREVADVLAEGEAHLKANTKSQDFTHIPRVTPSMNSGRWTGVAAVMLLVPVFALTLTESVGVTHLFRASAPQSDSVEPGGQTTPSPVADVAPSDADEWVALFNSRDLTGWKTQPDSPGKWEVKDGILIGSQRPGVLFSERGDYANFHLRAEARINLGGDSGILFRTGFGGRPEKVVGQGGDGYEMEVHKNVTYTRRTGTVTSLQRGAPPQILGLTTDDSLTQPDEWFTLEIIAEQNRFITKVNGQVTADCSDPLHKDSRGHIGLQVWSPNTLVQFRRIEITELPDSNTPRPSLSTQRFASDEWIDTLALINPQADKWDTRATGRNAWRVEQGELIVGVDDRGSKLLLPLDAAWQAFECEVELTRRTGTGGVNVNVPTSVGDCPVVLGTPGVYLGRKGGGVVLNEELGLVTGQRTTLRFDVHRDQNQDLVSVWINDALAGTWQGDRTSISTVYDEGYPHARRLSLWVHAGGSEFVFHRIRVRMLDGGTADSLRPVPGEALVPVAN